MAKRKNPSSPIQVVKRTRPDKLVTALTCTESVIEQAKPYLLATAKLPLDALTPIWKVGSNRQTNTKHVQSLYRIFTEQGLQREPDENHLRIACSRAEVDRMRDHVNSCPTPSRSCIPAFLAFDDWMVVNGTKVEVMAGQHRIEALKVFVAHLSSRSQGGFLEAEHLWWICDIYDIGE
jgi:hypothetical protein